MARSKAGRRPGSTRQKLLLAAMVDGAKQKDAGALVGYPSPQATNNAVARMADRVAAIFDKVGLTEEYIAAKIKESTVAERTETAQRNGEFTDLLVLPDNPVRLKALETAARLRRMFPQSDNEDDNKPTVAVQIVTNVQLDKP